MNKIVFAILAVVASFMLAESLTCNKCDVGLVGICINSGAQVCATNTTSCFTGKICLNTQGCLDIGACGTTNGTIMSVTYNSVFTCCSTDKCNPITISGATSAKLSVTAALGAALVASVWGSMLY